MRIHQDAHFHHFPSICRVRNSIPIRRSVGKGDFLPAIALSRDHLSCSFSDQWPTSSGFRNPYRPEMKSENARLSAQLEWTAFHLTFFSEHLAGMHKFRQKWAWNQPCSLQRMVFPHVSRGFRVSWGWHHEGSWSDELLGPKKKERVHQSAIFRDIQYCSGGLRHSVERTIIWKAGPPSVAENAHNRRTN